MRARLIAAGAVICALPGLAPAAGDDGALFSVERAGTRLVEDVYRLDAYIDYRFSPAVLDALENGVPLTVEVRVEVIRPRWWWWDAEVAVVSQHSLLQFHALSRQYLLTSLNTGAQLSFSRLQAALEAMGTLSDIPLLDRKLLAPEVQYQARLRAQLDIESLPSPLRPVAYLSTEWRLASEWFEWPLPS